MTPDALLRRGAPWLCLAGGGAELQAAWVKRLRAEAPRNTGVFVLRGARMHSKPELLKECAQVLSFPDYFGQNWDAFEECVQDLSWLDRSGVVLVVLCGDEVLEREPGQRGVFASILAAAARMHAEPEAGPWLRVVWMAEADAVAGLAAEWDGFEFTSFTLSAAPVV